MSPDAPSDAVRLDRWLWSVRLYKTRTLATDACRAGHVRLNGAPAKASAVVHPGDRIEARTGDRTRDLEVVRIVTTRVGAPIAAACLVDHSPPPPPAEARPRPLFTREPGAGRPTKRDRRQLDRFRPR